MHKLFLEGTIVSGLGEGAYFMSMPHYQKEIRKKLGFKAYCGTLNLRVRTKIGEFKSAKPIRIDGFKSNNKVFGGGSCYRAKISRINGSIIVPDLTKHNKRVIEFIAPVHIKTELKLKNGDKVKIELL